MNYFLRRRGLGKGSTEGICYFTSNLSVFRSDGFLPDPAGGYVIRWGCTATIPYSNKKILNQASAIHMVNNKKDSRLLFAQHGLAPISSDNVDNFDSYPAIIRPSKHSQGKQLWLVHDKDEAMYIIGDNKLSEYYISKYIPKTKEFRVFVMQGRVVWVAEKTPGNPSDLAWNVAKGGKFDNVRWNDWPKNVVENALRCFYMTELDFGGVDVMVDANGQCYCLEINSAPSQTSPYRQQCCSKAFDWLIKNTSDRFDFPTYSVEFHYKNCIHPGVLKDANN